MKKNKKFNTKQIWLLVMVVMVICSELFFGENKSRDDVSSGSVMQSSEAVTSEIHEDADILYSEDNPVPDSVGETEGSIPSVSEYLSFRNESLWESHYEKHGIEMGFSSMDEYLEAANLVLYDEDTLHKTEAEDGDDVYFLEETGEFVVVSTDGYIRTYFIPDDGIEYFNRQ